MGYKKFSPLLLGPWSGDDGDDPLDSQNFPNSTNNKSKFNYDTDATFPESTPDMNIVEPVAPAAPAENPSGGQDNVKEPESVEAPGE